MPRHYAHPVMSQRLRALLHGQPVQFPTRLVLSAGVDIPLISLPAAPIHPVVGNFLNISGIQLIQRRGVVRPIAVNIRIPIYVLPDFAPVRRIAEPLHNPLPVRTDDGRKA